MDGWKYVRCTDRPAGTERHPNHQHKPTHQAGGALGPREAAPEQALPGPRAVEVLWVDLRRGLPVQVRVRHAPVRRCVVGIWVGVGVYDRLVRRPIPPHPTHYITIYNPPPPPTHTNPGPFLLNKLISFLASDLPLYRGFEYLALLFLSGPFVTIAFVSSYVYMRHRGS